MRATIVIPFHRHLPHLGQSLPAARRSMPDAEIIVAADGSPDDCHPLAAKHGARVVEIEGPLGPATARNRAAAVSSGDILIFVDSDVVVTPDALPGMCRLLQQEPSIAGVFGAYDLSPAEPNFMSQYKNLAHAYVHEVGNRNAKTFWAGLGAIRADAFRAVGGFDERFGGAIEDIDLGCRLIRAGYALRLAPEFRGKHLKRWTLWSSIKTDVLVRGVPWTQVIHRYAMLSNDLNTSVSLRLSVVLAYASVLLALASTVTPWGLLAAAAALAVLVVLNANYYQWFYHQRGLPFACRVVPAHLIHHLCNGVSFVIGTSLHMAGRIGLRLPGALPTSAWSPSERKSQAGQTSTLAAR